MRQWPPDGKLNENHMSIPTSTPTFADKVHTVIGWIGDITTIYWIVSGLAGALIFVVGLLAWVLWKDARLFLNRRRPIKIFYALGGPNMEMETKTLRQSGFFKIPEDPTSNYQDCHNLTNHGLVIVGYIPGMPGLADIVAAVKAKKIPLIVYTKARLDPADQALLETYPWYSLCNVPLRIVSDAFTILSTFPIPKHD